jgi:hypothetical protein
MNSVGFQRQFSRWWLIAALIPVALAGAELAQSRLGFSFLLPGLGLLGLCALGILGLPIMLFRSWRLGRPYIRALLGPATVTTVAFVGLMVAMHWSWPLRRGLFARAADNGVPLVDAIRAFEHANGRPPEALSELVPAHLPSIPGTGLLKYPKFEYERFADPGGSLVWWDMGSRNGASISGLWEYTDGDLSHAILVLELNGSDVVTSARADRMPASVDERPFSAERWRADSQQRLQMVHDMAHGHRLRGMRRQAVEEIFGPPSGRRVLRDAAWELRIPCSLGILNWDVFFYWPSERYPERIYGGSTERIGRWAYVHE